MNVRRWVVRSLTAGAVLAEWVAVATERRALELVAKPAATGGLLLAALDAGLGNRPWGRPMATGLGLGLLGDVCLLADGRPAFLAGLGAFLGGHVCYLRAFARMGLRADLPRLAVGAGAVAASLAVCRDAVPTLLREQGPAGAAPVAVYMGVIAAMSLAAWSTRDPLLGVGSSLFVLSDAVIARDAFVAPVTRSGPAVMVPYLLGQGLIAAGAVRRTPGVRAVAPG